MLRDTPKSMRNQRPWVRRGLAHILVPLAALLLTAAGMAVVHANIARHGPGVAIPTANE